LSPESTVRVLPHWGVKSELKRTNKPPVIALRLTGARFFRWQMPFRTTCRDSRPRGVILWSFSRSLTTPLWPPPRIFTSTTILDQWSDDKKIDLPSTETFSSVRARQIGMRSDLRSCSRGARRRSVTHLVVSTRGSSCTQSHDTPGQRWGDGARHGGSLSLWNSSGWHPGARRQLGQVSQPMGARLASPSQALGRGSVRPTRFVGRMYVCELESSTPVYILLSFVNLCMFGLYCDMILFGGSSCLACTWRVFMLREIFAGVLPAHPARMWVWESVTVH